MSSPPKPLHPRRPHSPPGWLFESISHRTAPLPSTWLFIPWTATSLLPLISIPSSPPTYVPPPKLLYEQTGDLADEHKGTGIIVDDTTYEVVGCYKTYADTEDGRETQADRERSIWEAKWPFDDVVADVPQVEKVTRTGISGPDSSPESERSLSALPGMTSRGRNQNTTRDIDAPSSLPLTIAGPSEQLELWLGSHPDPGEEPDRETSSSPAKNTPQARRSKRIQAALPTGPNASSRLPARGLSRARGRARGQARAPNPGKKPPSSSPSALPYGTPLPGPHRTRRLNGLLLDPRPVRIALHKERIFSIHSAMEAFGLADYGNNYDGLEYKIRKAMRDTFDRERDLPVWRKVERRERERVGEPEDESGFRDVGSGEELEGEGGSEGEEEEDAELPSPSHKGEDKRAEGAGAQQVLVAETDSDSLSDVPSPLKERTEKNVADRGRNLTRRTKGERSESSALQEEAETSLSKTTPLEEENDEDNDNDDDDDENDEEFCKVCRQWKTGRFYGETIKPRKCENCYKQATQYCHVCDRDVPGYFKGKDKDGNPMCGACYQRARKDELRAREG